MKSNNSVISQYAGIQSTITNYLLIYIPGGVMLTILN